MFQTKQLSSINNTKQSSGVALQHIIEHTNKFALPKGHALLIVIALNNSHAARAKIDLQMSLTCNKGSTNPEYKSTQQDLTEIRI